MTSYTIPTRSRTSYDNLKLTINITVLCIDPSVIYFISISQSENDLRQIFRRRHCIVLLQKDSFYSTKANMIKYLPGRKWRPKVILHPYYCHVILLSTLCIMQPLLYCSQRMLPGNRDPAGCQVTWLSSQRWRCFML